MLNHWKNTDCSNKVWRNSMNVYCWTQQASSTFCGSCLVKAEWVWPLTPVVVSLQGRFTAAWRGRRGGRRVQAAAAARRSVSDLQPPNIWLSHDLYNQSINDCRHQSCCKKQKQKSNWAAQRSEFLYNTTPIHKGYQQFIAVRNELFHR